MKTSIKLFVTAMLFVATTAFAKAETRTINKIATESTIDQYIQIVANGNTKNLQTVFSDQFIQQINNKGKISTHNKAQVVRFLKGQQNIKQNCDTAYTIIEQNDDGAIAKVEMIYDGFTKVDYVTLSNEGNRWKVSNVMSTYP